MYISIVFKNMFEQFKIFKPKPEESRKRFEIPKTPDIVPGLQTLFKKFPFSKEEIEKNAWLEGLEFNTEGYLASIKKGSPAEKIFSKVIENGGDTDFALVSKIPSDFHVFEKIQDSPMPESIGRATVAQDSQKKNESFEKAA